MEWHLAQGTQESKPAEIEVFEHEVYLRKDISQKEITDDYGTHVVWEYNEVIIPKADGGNIVKFSNEIYQAKLDENSIAIDEIITYILEA